VDAQLNGPRRRSVDLGAQRIHRLRRGRPGALQRLQERTHRIPGAQNAIIADTGFWLALANRRDRHHAACKRALDAVKERLITTWPVLTETCHLLVSRLGPSAALAFVDSAGHGAFDVFELVPVHLTRVHQLMERYRDLPLDLADASLVLLAEELDSGRILSTDERDFRTCRFKNRKPFKNLLTL
jgi:hypothetical protein